MGLQLHFWFILQFLILYMHWGIMCVGLPENKDDRCETFPTNIEQSIKKFKTDRPVIGIVAMPMKNKHILAHANNALDESHIGASFVKLMEGAGARVVPLLESFNDTKVKSILKLINGVLLPGGLEDIVKSDYQRISKLAFEYSIVKYNEGEIWPIFGVCRGFQQLFTMLDEGKYAVTSTDALNITMPLEFTEEAKTSRLMSHASAGIWKLLENEKITFNAHINGFSPKTIYNSKELNRFWRIISTNKDRNGKHFISTVEGRKYPFYGVQWHPEKALYVWNPIFHINHTIYSIMISQYFANFFVSEARKNSNSFHSRQEEAHYLIYQYRGTYVGNIIESPYEQVYMWKLYK